MMKYVTGLRCTVCDTIYSPQAVKYHCPTCGPVGTLDVIYDYAAITAEFTRAALKADPERSMWRYRPLLPVREDSPLPPLTVGWTPLYPAHRLASELGMTALWVKDDGRNPTASLKDRASAMAVVKAREDGADVITTASTGNAAAALAGLAASVGFQNVIFVPADAPKAKIAQLLVYGSTVLLVKGSYDQAFDLCMQASERYGWYLRNTGVNPYMTEGKKTAAYEIAEQLDWDVPDYVVVGVGDGCIIGGLHKGFADLLELGWIGRMPRLIGVQAEGSSPLYRAWAAGIEAKDMEPVEAHTIADSICAGLPRDRVKAMRAVRETDGAFVSVSDEEILAAIPLLAQTTGVFAEPAGAAPLAGLRRALEDGIIRADARVVILATGSGLKDIAGAMKSVGAGYEIEPTMDAVERVMEEIGGHAPGNGAG